MNNDNKPIQIKLFLKKNLDLYDPLLRMNLNLSSYFSFRTTVWSPILLIFGLKQIHTL